MLERADFGADGGPSAPESRWSAREILGVEADASPATIRRAYLDRVRTWHPDRFPNDPARQQQAEAATKLINQAYATLARQRPARSAAVGRGGRVVSRPARTGTRTIARYGGLRGLERRTAVAVLLVSTTALTSVLASFLVLYVMAAWL